MDYRLMYDQEFLAAVELRGKDVTLTIDHVEAAKVKGAEGKENKRPVVIFTKNREDGRPLKMVVNRTNGATIAGLYGKDTDGWRGKRITLYPQMVKAFGKTDEALRVRPVAPPEPKQTTQREPGDDA